MFLLLLQACHHVRNTDIRDKFAKTIASPMLSTEPQRYQEGLVRKATGFNTKEHSVASSKKQRGSIDTFRIQSRKKKKK